MTRTVHLKEAEKQKQSKLQIGRRKIDNRHFYQIQEEWAEVFFGVGREGNDKPLTKKIKTRTIKLLEHYSWTPEVPRSIWNNYDWLYANKLEKRESASSNLPSNSRGRNLSRSTPKMRLLTQSSDEDKPNSLTEALPPTSDRYDSASQATPKQQRGRVPYQTHPKGAREAGMASQGTTLHHVNRMEDINCL